MIHTPNNPSVSVIIPTYNRAEYLEEAIKSVLGQKIEKGQTIEVIVVDDGSNDNTDQIIKRFGDRVAYYKLPHSGLPAVARNFGIKKARAELIAFQDSDDLWVPGKLKLQLPAFDDPEVILCYGNAQTMDATGKLTAQTVVPGSHLRDGYIFKELVKENVIPTLTVVARKSALLKIGGFRESMRLRGLEDYELWLRLTGLRLGKVKSINKVLAYYRRHEKNVSLASARHPLEDIIFVLKHVRGHYGERIESDSRKALKDSIVHLTAGLNKERNTPSPLVSIVMSVYNAEKYLAEAIESILNQTYKNFEFIIVDDGSTDNSASIIKNYKDRRIKYFRQSNKGLAGALNLAIGKAEGKYIARMDADDISAPERIEKQVEWLEKNEHIAIAGTSFALIDEFGRPFKHSYHLDRPEDLKLELFVRNPFGHGTIMLRRLVLEEVGPYQNSMPYEDYELWWNILKKFNGANLTEELYKWRVVRTGISHGSIEKNHQLIHAFLKKIWKETPLPIPGLAQIRSGLSHYSMLGKGYKEQYQFMLCALCLGAFKMEQRGYAIKLLLKILLSDPTILGPLLKLRREPLSHNYLLGLIHRG